MSPQQNSMAFMDPLMAGYAPVASGIEPQASTGFEGIPFLGDNPLLSTLITPYLQKMMGSVGLMPMGLHDQNVYDLIRRQKFAQAQQDLASKMADSERAGMLQTMRGIAGMFGQKWTPDVQAAASSIADALQLGAPFMAMAAPAVLEQLGGAKGSPTVMALNMLRASRYRIDPVTGRMGMDPDAVQEMAKSIFKDIYEKGDIAKVHGLTAGRLGGMFEQMVARGLLQAEPLSAREQLEDVFKDMSRQERKDLAKRVKITDVEKGDVSALSVDDIDKVIKDTEVIKRIRKLDTGRVKESLESYTDAIAAMRDIFGDMGQPNAPVQKLFAALEAMTNGATSQLDPTRLGQIVRQTHALAVQTGVPMQAALAMQQHASRRAAEMGLNNLFGIDAYQGGMAFGAAYRSAGFAANPAYGAMNADAMMQLDTNLRVNAAASSAVNRMNAALRIRAMGGDLTPEAKAYVEAVEAGRTTFDGGRSVNLSEEEFVRMFSTGTRSESFVRDILRQRDTNLEYGLKYNTAALGRKLQPEEVRKFIAGRVAGALPERMRQLGLSQSESVQIAGQVSNNIARRIMSLSDEVRSDPEKRNEAIGKIIEEELQGTAAGNRLQAMSAAEREQFLNESADFFHGRLNESIKQSRFRGFGNTVNLLRAMDEEVLAEGDRRQIQASISAETARALTPLGRGTLLQRAVSYLQEKGADPNADLPKLLGTALGGVESQKVKDKLRQPLTNVHERLQKIRNIQDELNRLNPQNEDDRKRMEKLRSDLYNEQKMLRSSVDELVKVGTETGVYDKKSGLILDDEQKANLARIRVRYSKMSDPNNPYHKFVAARVLQARRRRSAERLADKIKKLREKKIEVSDDEIKKLRSKDPDVFAHTSDNELKSRIIEKKKKEREKEIKELEKKLEKLSKPLEGKDAEKAVEEEIKHWTIGDKDYLLQDAAREAMKDWELHAEEAQKQLEAEKDKKDKDKAKDKKGQAADSSKAKQTAAADSSKDKKTAAADSPTSLRVEVATLHVHQDGSATLNVDSNIGEAT